MTEIFKVCNLTDNDTIEKITVYFGSKNYTTNLNDLFKNNMDDSLFKGVFSEDEIKQITRDNIPVIFTNQSIYLDDSIETIKKKVIIDSDKQISFDEIYLFGKQIQRLDNTQIYDNLTQYGKITLNKDMLFQFLSNISNFDITSVPIKDTYTYNDIIDLNLSNKQYLLDIAIGQHIITSDNKYSYTINPYNIINFDKKLISHAENIITTSNKELLLTS